MGKNDIVNHGTLADSTNFEALCKAQVNQPSFLGTTNNVVKSANTKGKTLKKVLRPQQKNK